jgi:hypothetical protein
MNEIKEKEKEKKSLARPPGSLGQNFCCFVAVALQSRAAGEAKTHA